MNWGVFSRNLVFRYDSCVRQSVFVGLHAHKVLTWWAGCFAFDDWFLMWFPRCARISQDDHFFFHEVIEGAGEAVTPQMYFGLGQVAEFAFGSVVGGAFKNNDLSGLGNLASGFFDSSKAVVFIDNHDTQRGDAPLTYKDGQQYILATVFMLGHPYGHPKVCRKAVLGELCPLLCRVNTLFVIFSNSVLSTLGGYS